MLFRFVRKQHCYFVLLALSKNRWLPGASAFIHTITSQAERMQPLPSDDPSSRQPRSSVHRLQARMNSDQEPNSEPRKKRRVNRPGFNSYLKVLLDDRTMDILHQMSLEIQKRLVQENAQEQGPTEDNNMQRGEANKDPTDRKSIAKPLKFKPRSRQSLHMTLFFGGETICALPQNELSEWHRRLSIRLAESGFYLQEARHPTPDVSGDYSFRVKSLSVFPPQRNNLVVAKLEPTQVWHDLHNDIRQIAQDENCSQALADVTRFSKNQWVAHVTLGNLYGGPKSKIRSLYTLLDDIFESSIPPGIAESSQDGAIMFRSDPVGIGMGGPVPEQVRLDWDFHCSPSADAQERTDRLSSIRGGATASSMAPAGNVSQRCVKALTPSSPYADAFMQAMKHQYDPVARPDGFISLCVAENKLSIDLLRPRLSQIQSIQSAFDDPRVYCYNSFLGLPHARQVAASFIAKRFLRPDVHSISTNQSHEAIDPAHVGIGSGAAGILHSIFYLLGNEGDCCLVPTPYYAAFDSQMSMVAGVSPFGFEIADPVAGPTENELDSAYIKARSKGCNPKFVLITNPHNPLGIIYKPDVVATIVKWARKQNLHTIVDEVYALSTHRKHGHGFQSVIQILDNQLEDNVHWVWSVSKDFGASGLRVGYVYSQNETFMKGLANLNGFSGVSQPMQMLVSELLSDDDFVETYLDQSRQRLLQNCQICMEKLNEMGLAFAPADAGLFVYADFSSLFPDKTAAWETKFSKLMVDHARLLLTPGGSQRDSRPGMFRICYAWVSPRDLQVGMERLARLVGRIRDVDLLDFDETAIGGVL